MTNLLKIKFQLVDTKNVSEVIRAGPRLLENEKNKIKALRNAIEEGLNSPLVNEFDFNENLKRLKAEKRKMAKVIFWQKPTDDLKDI